MSHFLKPVVRTSSPELEEHYIDTKHGLWFYDRLENLEYAPNIYSKLLNQAKEKIYVWDPYLQ